MLDEGVLTLAHAVSFPFHSVDSTTSAVKSTMRDYKREKHHQTSHRSDLDTHTHRHTHMVCVRQMHVCVQLAHVTGVSGGSIDLLCFICVCVCICPLFFSLLLQYPPGI